MPRQSKQPGDKHTPQIPRTGLLGGSQLSDQCRAAIEDGLNYGTPMTARHELCSSSKCICRHHQKEGN